MFFDFVIRSGRALIYPIYKGMYERGQFIWETEPSAYRDQIIHQYKDLARQILRPCQISKFIGLVIYFLFLV